MNVLGQPSFTHRYRFDEQESERLPGSRILAQRADAQKLFSIKSSGPAYASKIRLWLRFAVDILKIDPLDPSSAHVSLYLGIFRNANSAQQYLSALRWLFAYVDLSHRITKWDTLTLSKQLAGLSKMNPQGKSEKLYISWDLAAKLVNLRTSRGDYERACVYALASQIMPRVGDELIPLCSDSLDTHSAVRHNENTIWFHLRSRKNWPNGATIARKCICNSKRHVLCALHALIHFVQRTQRPASEKGRLFQVTYPKFLRELKHDLAALGVPKAMFFTTKCFRRGSAMEILKRGGNLATVLKAGQWRSHAFLNYLEESEIDTLTLFQVVDDAENDESTNISDMIPKPPEVRMPLQDRPSTEPKAGPRRSTRAKPLPSKSLRTMHEFFQAAPPAEPP